MARRPSGCPDRWTMLLRLISRLKRIDFSFKPLSAIVNVSKMEVSLTGLLNQYVSNKFVQQTKEVYELRFVYKNGQLLIKSFILTGVQKD